MAVVYGQQAPLLGRDAERFITVRPGDEELLSGFNGGGQTIGETFYTCHCRGIEWGTLDRYSRRIVQASIECRRKSGNKRKL